MKLKRIMNSTNGFCMDCMNFTEFCCCNETAITFETPYVDVREIAYDCDDEAFNCTSCTRASCDDCSKYFN